MYGAPELEAQLGLWLVCHAVPNSTSNTAHPVTVGLRHVLRTIYIVYLITQTADAEKNP